MRMFAPANCSRSWPISFCICANCARADAVSASGLFRKETTTFWSGAYLGGAAGGLDGYFSCRMVLRFFSHGIYFRMGFPEAGRYSCRFPVGYFLGGGVVGATGGTRFSGISDTPLSNGFPSLGKFCGGGVSLFMALISRQLLANRILAYAHLMLAP